MESNPVLAAIQGRRTLRNYTSGEVGKELLLSVLEAGRWAPSGKNGQPWRFIVIGDREIKEALSHCTRYASIIAQAPVAIVVFLDSQSSYDRTKDLQAIGACMENMLLAAHSLGLGASWQGEILNSRAEVEGLLGVPPGYELMAVLTLGFPSRLDQTSSRKALEEIAYLDRYGNPLPMRKEDG